MATKSAEENKLKQSLAANSNEKAQFGDPWAAIAKAMAVERQIYYPLTYLERRGGFRGELAGIARALVRSAYERTLPNGTRLREYRDSALPSLEQNLFSAAPIYKSREKALLADSLAEMQEKMPDNPVVKKVLDGKSPAQVAGTLIDQTKLQDVAVRKQLYQGGEKAIEASTDPLIVLMREVDPAARAIRKQYDDQVDAVTREYGGDIAKIRFAMGGNDIYPDATFTLRLSYGTVRGYSENGEGIAPKGTKLPYFTTMGLAMALKPLDDAFGVREVMVVTMQAISGAGYPGVPSLDILDNVIPYIGGEEDKVETEPRKILGRLSGKSVEFAAMKISAQCNRVHVIDGHTESVSVRLSRQASLSDVARVLAEFSGEPQRLRLPSAPDHPIIVAQQPDRPQPRRDRNAGNGMSVVVGRLRPCEILDYKFTLLVHNTIRGAAGAAILNAELLAERGLLPHRMPVEQGLVSERKG